MELAFEARIVEWRGPAPYVYAELPVPAAQDVAVLAAFVSYGWGAVPVEARIGDTSFRTSLFPKDGTYLLPLRAAVRRAEGTAVGDRVPVVLRLGPA